MLRLLKKRLKAMFFILLPGSIFLLLHWLTKHDVFGMGELPYWLGYNVTKAIQWIGSLF
jgi:hypothetical protein